MPASEAQIRANQANAAKSTGPKSVAGKENSRRNALKHGLTGEGLVVPAEDAAEVEERFQAFCQELQPTGELATTLVRRAATMAVRMERCSERQIAETTERVVQAITDCAVPDGVDPAEAHRIRTEAGRRAAFDTSKEGILARRYEASAERSFYRALKEFRQVEKSGQRLEPERPVEKVPSELGSFLETTRRETASPARSPEFPLPTLPGASHDLFPTSRANFLARVDVPITIGRAR